MRTMPDWLALLGRVILIVLIPVVLTLTNVRLLLTPFFPRIEYRLPGFPDDPYGMTLADRLQYTELSREYLLNNAGIDFVRNFRFPPGITAPAESCPYYLDGDCNRFYNDRELKHMLDVKVVLHWVLNVWMVGGVVALLTVGLLYAFGEKAALRAGLLGGAGLTLALLVSIVTYLLLNFNSFFTNFHRVFFEGQSWIFLWSDSFIRLFPERFWQDTFIFIGAATIVEAVVLAAWAWYRLK